MGKIEHRIQPPDRPEILIRAARPSDMVRIQMLYAEVYGGNYSIPIIIDKDKMKDAIVNDHYYWLVSECGDRIVGSLVYEVDLEQRISKAFGAVVSNDFRKLELAHTMMKLVLQDITSGSDLVDFVYATTRTANYAPQKLTEALGFVKLGIFPNTHKVQENETHCLTGYFPPGALAKRRPRPALIPEVVPFYDIVSRQLPLYEYEPSVASGPYSDHNRKIETIPFEFVAAEAFVKARYSSFRSTGFFERIYMPFHEPNLMLVSPDQSTEIYLTYSKKDKYSVVLGGRSSEESFARVLESIAKKMSELDMAYMEVLIDAYTPLMQREALDARFIPSAYSPCMKKEGEQRLDCIAFSRTFEVLDFRNVKLISLYRNFLKEYLKLWRENYIELAFAPEHFQSLPERYR